VRLLAIVVMFVGWPATDPSQAADVDYTSQIKPLLKQRCFACHGVLKGEGGLRLDSGAHLSKGGDSGVVVKAGKSADSELIARLTSGDDNLRMPQEGERLKPDQIALISRWIDEGARIPADDPPETDPADHWALRPVRRPTAPAATTGVANPIDGFLNTKLTAAGMFPAAAADRRTLLRRLSLDLTGLPPTREQLAAFEADQSPQAYEAIVDRMLASPQYGERWGRHWMDVWRYSDWWGLGAEVRNSHKHIWRWRDWIIESLNEDKGYDQMVREMIAADELYPSDLDKLRASGFLARHYFKFNRTTWLDETIEHTAKAFLGLTVNCCKCHDHKYDPITQADYYRFRAIFEPYRVRIDQWPGEADLEKDGLSRAFDGELNDTTWLHIRGDDRNPDKSRTLAAGIPAIFERVGLSQLDVRPVTLPPDASQPGLRPFVLENSLKAADAQIAAARTAVEASQKTLREVEAKAAAAAEAAKEALKTKDVPKPEPLVKDDFAKELPERWEKVEGTWTYADGHVQQKDVGDKRGVLRLKGDVPVDFEARIRFRTLGGTMWKSVGLTFDVVDNAEALVYLSAVTGGSKLQVATKTGGAYSYPADGLQPRQVPLSEPQEMLVRVRGPLVNASVNGDTTLVYRLPTERKAGRMELITYDAHAEFLSFELTPLAASVKLEEMPSKPMPASTTPPLTVDQARIAVTVAEKGLATAELEPASLRARAAADAALVRQSDAPETKEAVRLAVVAERRIAAAKAAEEVAKSELELAKAEMAKKAEVEKKVAAAKDALTKATTAIDTPDGPHTPLRGGKKTVESPTETQEHALLPFPATSTGRRTALAQWMTDPRNPLTARVAVNHIWSRHFGRPLVPTVFDFGRRAPEPPHAELLDYLAGQLIDNRWSMKHIHRLIVTSAAYRRTSSNLDAEQQIAGDPENRLFWRMNPIRMEAQVVRDALLSLGGTLDPKVGGPPVHPMTEPNSTRRSLYFVHSHNDHDKFLSLFDDASVLDCYRRTESIVPQQALALSNSNMALATAERISARLNEQPDLQTEDAFIAAAFETVLAAKPTPDEIQTCRETLSVLTKVLKDGNQPDAERRARKSLVQALLNHNDFVTIR
jgi:mono/diheme cytochrome c family protein